MDLSGITDQTTKRFLTHFFLHRHINKEIYKRIPEDKLDFRMVNNASKKSDSPRESIAHQVYVTRKYIYGVRTGMLKFDGVVDTKLERTEEMSKDRLLSELDRTEKELVSLFADPKTQLQKVSVPWSATPVSAIECMFGMQDHEILHTGWNLALMDHLHIERFPLLKSVWG